MPPPRSPALELLVEQVARAVTRARERQGDAAVRERIAAAISPEDAETAARVLRILGRELGDAPVDLGALDARLQALAGARLASGDDEADDAAPGEHAMPDGDVPSATAPDAADAPVAGPTDPRGRPHPPTGLRSAMRGRRR